MNFKFRRLSIRGGKIAVGVICSILPLFLLMLNPVSSLYTAVDKAVSLDPIFFETGIEKKGPENSIFFGKQNLIYFGYLNCRTVCHGTLSKIKKIASESQNQPLQIVLVSLDPKNESPDIWEKMFQEVPKGKIRIIRPESSEKSFELAKSFGNRIYKNPVTFEIEHQDILFWVNAEGRVKGIFPDFSENEKFSPSEILKSLQ